MCIQRHVAYGAHQISASVGDKILVRALNRIADSEQRIAEKDELIAELQSQALTEPLTGLINRRGFEDSVRRAVASAHRFNESGVLAYIDLDEFKPVNDRFGHETGDVVLKYVAEFLHNSVRATDTVSRIGGDEFALWLDGADDLTAAERAEHLTITAPRMLRELTGGHEIRLGMSIGIATRWPAMREGLDETLQRADQAMYQAKCAGRGQWRAWRAEAV